MPTAPLTFVFANAAGELYQHPAGYAVLRYKDGFWGLSEIMALLTNVAQLLLAHGWHRLYADSRLMPELPPEAKAWVSTNWLSSLLSRPDRLHVALLPSTNQIAQAAASKVRNQAPSNVQYAYFADEAAAHAFLAGLPL